MSRKRRTPQDEPWFLLRSSASVVRGGMVLADHTHPWQQLVHVTTGLMTVSTEEGSWVAPPNWAILIPASIRHSIRFVGESALRTAWLRPGSSTELPDRCTVNTVSPLLRELLQRAAEIGMLDRRDREEQALTTLIAGELRQADVAPLTLPQPASDPMRRATALIADRAAEAASVAALARAVGMGTRSFERRFFAETGMTPGRWRQQQALLGALERLAAGAPIKAAAAHAGYAAPSAFIAAFRQSFGITPGRYFG